ncbi:HNH endonuclease [bacterium]|nr:HNH endonuclease [bacterium]
MHNKYLHTLGNLSLSSVQKNSKMSNDSFLQKKKILLSDESKFNVLNKMLEKLDKFTEQDLINRTNELTQKVIERYDFFKPNVNK